MMNHQKHSPAHHKRNLYADKNVKKKVNVPLYQSSEYKNATLKTDSYNVAVSLVLQRTPVFNICERIIILKSSMDFSCPFSS